MTSPPDSAAQKRSEWRDYFELRLTGGAGEVDAATEAAIRALEGGADINGIIAAGMEGARTWDPSTADAVAGSAASGIVTGMQQRMEAYGRLYYTVLSFRLERTDDAGHPMTPIAVEMRGRRFRGGITNGDVVDIGQFPQPGIVARPRVVRNLTVGTDVQAIGGPFPTVAAVIALVIFTVFLIFLINVIHVMNSINSQLPQP
jgi:hypothetical protein